MEIKEILETTGEDREQLRSKGYNLLRNKIFRCELPEDTKEVANKSQPDDITSGSIFRNNIAVLYHETIEESQSKKATLMEVEQRHKKEKEELISSH
jgi:hypothetical protein